MFFSFSFFFLFNIWQYFSTMDHQLPQNHHSNKSWNLCYYWCIGQKNEKKEKKSARKKMRKKEKFMSVRDRVPMGVVKASTLLLLTLSLFHCNTFHFDFLRKRFLQSKPTKKKK